MSVTRSSFRTSIAMATVAAITTLAAAAPASGQTQAFKSPLAPAPTRAAFAADDARRLFEEGHWREARKIYERAIDEARAQDESGRDAFVGQYGREAFEGLANLQFALDDLKGAASTFDELGMRASAYGDPETEITAFTKSALLWAQAGDSYKAGLRVPRLKTLIKSPVISEATRQMVAERIAK